MQATQQQQRQQQPHHMLHRNGQAHAQPNLQERSTLVCFGDTRVLMDLPCESIEQAKQDVINDLQELSERGFTSSDIAFCTQLGTEVVEIRSNKWRRLEAGAVLQVVVTHRGRDSSDVSGGSSSRDGLRAHFAQAATGPMQVDVDGWRQNRHPYAGRHGNALQSDHTPGFFHSVLPSPPLSSTSQDVHPGQQPTSRDSAAQGEHQACRDTASHPPDRRDNFQPGYPPGNTSHRPSWTGPLTASMQVEDYRHPSHSHPLQTDSYATFQGTQWHNPTSAALAGPDFHETPLRSYHAYTNGDPAVYSSPYVPSSKSGYTAPASQHRSSMHDLGYADTSTVGNNLLDRRRASMQPMRRADRGATGPSSSPGPALAAPSPIRKHASQGFLVAYDREYDPRAHPSDGWSMDAPVGSHSTSGPRPSADYPPQPVSKLAPRSSTTIVAAQAPLMAPGNTGLVPLARAAQGGSSSEHGFSPFSSDSEDDSTSGDEMEPDLPTDLVEQTLEQPQPADSLGEPDRRHAVRRLRSTPEVGSLAQGSPASRRLLRKTKGKPVPPPHTSALYSALAPPPISISAPGAGSGDSARFTSGTKRAPTSWPNTPVKRSGAALSPPAPKPLPASAAASSSGQPAAINEQAQPGLYPWSVPGMNLNKTSSTRSRADSPLPILFQPRTSAAPSKLSPGPEPGRSALVREPNHAHTHTNTGMQGSMGANWRMVDDGAAGVGDARVRSRAQSMNAAAQQWARPPPLSWTSEGAPAPPSYRDVRAGTTAWKALDGVSNGEAAKGERGGPQDMRRYAATQTQGCRASWAG